MKAAGIATVGEARDLGWTVIARCAASKRRSRRPQRECRRGASLDLATLAWMRGPGFPLARLENYLQCPQCGARKVALIFSVPPRAIRAQVHDAT